mmetsp:Transcript_22338/g.46562  ORF Transcript_22338/g.46562 Transcript_22338/m.46562 type:complete len:179 (-) Transcript_22338:1013-1549(-)
MLFLAHSMVVAWPLPKDIAIMVTTTRSFAIAFEAGGVNAAIVISLVITVVAVLRSFCGCFVFGWLLKIMRRLPKERRENIQRNLATRNRTAEISRPTKTHGKKIHANEKARQEIQVGAFQIHLERVGKGAGHFASYFRRCLVELGQKPRNLGGVTSLRPEPRPSPCRRSFPTCTVRLQ